MPVIYLDVLLILNLWIDFLLLAATARLRRLPLRRGRLLLAAAIGAVGSCVLFLPPLSMPVALLLRVLGTVIISLVAFRFRGWRTFWQNLLSFFVISGAFAGMVSALWYFITPFGFLVVNGVVYYDATASLLIQLTTVSYVAIWLFEFAMRRRAPKNRYYRLLLRYRGKSLVCCCLYDTGSTLREPFSGKPAVLIDRKAAQPILPPDFDGVSPSANGKMRFVPFHSLGGDGLLPAFEPQYMEIADENGRAQDITGSFLAVCESLGHGEYTALVGTDIGDLLTEGSRG